MDGTRAACHDAAECAWIEQLSQETALVATSMEKNPADGPRKLRVHALIGHCTCLISHEVPYSGSV